MSKAKRPLIEFLTRAAVERIIAEARDVLEKTGVMIGNDAAIDILGDSGARIDIAKRHACIPSNLIDRCVASAPSSINIYDRNGKLKIKLRGKNVYFNPGSTALNILDSQTGRARKAVTKDVIDFARLTDALDRIAAQSTSVISSDVPHEIADRYRLYLALQNCEKPIVTGTFTIEGFEIMKEMLVAVVGDAETLREKPIAIFDACPSPPLKWSNLTCQCLIDCARSGVPAELVSMPLTGATAPLTLTGALVQHTAENLSGVVIHQLANPGAPIIYGGSPAAFDMRKGTTPMGAIETLMIDSAYAQVGRYLGLPTHAYMGLSDSKTLDAQASLESTTGIMLAALAGVNMIAGPGMLEFESCQSLEKLVIDNEICGMALRLVEGITPRGDLLGEDLFGDIYSGDHFLTSPSTLKWLREEMHFPGEIIDRSNREEWQNEGAKNAETRAKEIVAKILSEHQAAPLPADVQNKLRKIMLDDAKRHGLSELPRSPAQARVGS